MHIGAAGTDQALRYAAYAHEIGVDSVASVSPFYYSGHAYRWKDILSYHETVLKNVTLPYCVYNNPRTTSFALTAENLRELALMGVSGLKDSGNNVPLFQEYMNATKGLEFNCMPGSGSTMLECFRMGAKAIVAGTSVCFPEEVMKLYNAIVEGKSDNELDKLQEEVSNCRDRQMRAIMRPAAAYIILKERGVDVGSPRHPWPTTED
jgi:dihydrodipicolinate synthase/N-acetylneuraminate lyase